MRDPQWIRHGKSVRFGRRRATGATATPSRQLTARAVGHSASLRRASAQGPERRIEALVPRRRPRLFELLLVRQSEMSLDWRYRLERSALPGRRGLVAPRQV